MNTEPDLPDTAELFARLLAGRNPRPLDEILDRLDQVTDKEARHHRQVRAIVAVAAAVLVAVGGATFAASRRSSTSLKAGTHGSTTASRHSGKGSVHSAAPGGLGGLVTSADAAFVKTPLGVVVVDAAHKGHPAIAVPTSSGAYEWMSNNAVGPLGGAVAWLDGDVVRVVGHRCRPPSPGESTTTDDTGNTWLDCPSVDLGALRFSIASKTWSGDVATVALHSKVVDLDVGNGSQLIGTVSDGAPATGVALIDVKTGTVTLLPAGASLGSTICKVPGGFVTAAECH